MKISKKMTQLLFSVFLFIGCKPEKMVFNITDKYTGPSMVFIYADNSVSDSSKSIIILNGLGRINADDVNRKFEFRSLEKQLLIPIVSIGSEDTVDENLRCIFQLVKGASNLNYLNKDFSSINFFVGTKKDFSKWSQQNQNMFKFFDEVGVDWYNFYNSVSDLSGDSQ